MSLISARGLSAYGPPNANMMGTNSSLARSKGDALLNKNVVENRCQRQAYNVKKLSTCISTRSATAISCYAEHSDPQSPPPLQGFDYYI